MAITSGRGSKVNNRRFGGVSGVRPDHKAARVKMAQERQAEWDRWTPAQKVADLDRRLGVGVGAVKQRAKLAKLAK